ncbi:MAG: hypothetical protein JW839_01070 [Candidatus Lokiarchaeota archaeon]|nr:hypothetical protein [Candidatus Lokiarchaeota archaeon]
MSITDLISTKGLQALLARAATAYGTMGIGGKDMQRCIEYTVRYGLGSGRLHNEKAPAELHKAIAHVACHQVADLIAGTARGEPTRRRGPSHPSVAASMAYWIDKVCEVIGIDTWLDDSLDKWFLDTHGPLADVIVQACRRRVMDHLATCITGGVPANHDDLVIDVIHDLQARFPALARFTRHLPSVVVATIEQDVLGIPLVDKAEPAASAMAVMPATATPRATRASPSASSTAIAAACTPYPAPTTTINPNTAMRPTYP